MPCFICESEMQIYYLVYEFAVFLWQTIICDVCVMILTYDRVVDSIRLFL